MSIKLTLTTIDSRIKSLHLVIESLLRNHLPLPHSQKIEIHVYISNSPFLVDRGITFIPDSLQGLMNMNNSTESNFYIYLHYVPNCGPHRKYIYSNLSSEDIFITVDDDTIYPVDFIERMVSAVNQFDCVVAMRGREITTLDYSLDPYQSWKKRNLSKHPSLLSVGTGKDGIAYKKNFLHANVWNVSYATRYAQKADDLWLKAHSLLQGVPTVLLNLDIKDEFEEIGDPLSKESLYNAYNKKGGNNDALMLIDLYLMTSFQTNFFNLIQS